MCQPKIYASEFVDPSWQLDEWDPQVCLCLRPFKFHCNHDERAHERNNPLVAGKFDICLTSFEMAMKERTALCKFSCRYIIIIIAEARHIKGKSSILAKTMKILHQLLVS
jgi:SWI/SNF-related matrix-associated actin-dependent regulator of chromatin subfamily A member 5